MQHTMFLISSVVRTLKLFVYTVVSCLMKVPGSLVQGAVDDSLQMIIGFSVHYSCLLAQRRY